MAFIVIVVIVVPSAGCVIVHGKAMKTLVVIVTLKNKEIDSYCGALLCLLKLTSVLLPTKCLQNIYHFTGNRYEPCILHKETIKK